MIDPAEIREIYILLAAEAAVLIAALVFCIHKVWSSR